MLAVAGVTALLTVATVALVLAVTDHRAIRMARFGDTAAATLAELVVEPLMRQDRLHLGVIGNRLAAMPEISGVASYSADDRLLATTGNLSGPQYSAPVTIDGDIVGYVRVGLNPPAFEEAGTARWLSLLALVLLAPLTVATGWALAAAIGRGDLAVKWPRWRDVGAAGRTETAAAPEASADTPDEEAEAVAMPAEVRHYLLAVNLYNQLTLTPDARDFEQALCADLADRVAEIYHAQVVDLPGVGILVDFDHTNDPDRPFHVVCASFLLVRLLNHEAPFGRYRLGINLAVCAEDQPLAIDDPAVADAALLSALARNGTVAISTPFRNVLTSDERVASEPLKSPLLDELSCAGGGCLLTALEPTIAARVAQQADQLETERDATSNPSTF